MEYQKNAPATVNDPALTAARCSRCSSASLGAGNVKIVEPSMGGEDFAYFADQVPGFFYRLGVVKPGTTSGGLHTPTFRGDDSAVPVGIRIDVAAPGRLPRLLKNHTETSSEVRNEK